MFFNGKKKEKILFSFTNESINFLTDANYLIWSELSLFKLDLFTLNINKTIAFEDGFLQTF